MHPKNEIFLDVVESLNLLVAANGTVLRSEVSLTTQLARVLVRGAFMIAPQCRSRDLLLLL